MHLKAPIRTHTLAQHTHNLKRQTQTKIYSMIGLNLSKALHNVCTLYGISYQNNMRLLSSVIQWSHLHRNSVNWLPCWWPPLIIHGGYGQAFLKLLSSNVLFLKWIPNCSHSLRPKLVVYLFDCWYINLFRDNLENEMSRLELFEINRRRRCVEAEPSKQH